MPMLTDLLRQKKQNSHLIYVGKVAYACLLLFLFVAIITLVFGVFEAKMSFVTIFGEDNWKPIDACSLGVKSILFNTWTVLLLYTGFLLLLAGLPLYVSLPAHWMPYELWNMINNM